MIRSQMVTRLASAAVGLPFLGAAVWYGPRELLLALAVALAAIGAWEFCRLASGAALRPPSVLMAVWAGALVVNGHLEGDHTLAVLAAGLPVSLAWFLIRGPGERVFADWGATVAGSLYLGLPLSFALLIFAQEQGREWLLLALLAAFATDTSAYLVGRPLGRHRMAPAISPGKSWEGAAGGLAGGAGACLALASILDLPLTLAEAALVGAAVGVTAQLGDLAESLLKRAAGAKEAGGLIPGHGGLLDRMDSVAFVLVVLYYLARWLAPW